MRAAPQYLMTRPRLLSALHFLFQFRVAPAVSYERDTSSQDNNYTNGDCDDSQHFRPTTADTLASSVPSLYSNAISTREERQLNKIDRALLRAVAQYFDGFDLDRTGTIDWRDLVVRLRPLLKPLDTPSQHLEFAFELFTAQQPLLLPLPAI